jgi:RNA polymerase sigma-70 factor (ECF subfamily)
VDSDHTTHLQCLLDRLRQGDDTAHNELVGRAYERLRRLARKILRQDFPRLDRLHGTTTVLHETALRLLKALQEVKPATVREFFALAARHIRWALLDLARRANPEVALPERPADGSSQGGQPDERPDSSNDPAKLALWTEFHRAVEALPAAEREVVDLHWYQGLTQAEIARLLGVPPKQVSLRWISARLKLCRQVPGLKSLVPGGG